MANRLTMHSGYRNQLGKAYNACHNQRERFGKPQKGDTPPPPNRYWDYTGSLGGDTFSEGEKAFYGRFLGPHVKRQNDKAKARRQYGRMTTVAAYKEKHPPEEVLLYLGTKNVNPDTLEAVFLDFRGWLLSQWDKEKGGVMPLNAALHLDETTPHIHFRQAYLYRDKDGDWQVSQNKALDVMGYQRPDPSKPVGTHNNAKMTFTAACREKLFEIAKSYGVELETEPLPKNEVGLPMREFVQREEAREAAAKEQQALEEMLVERRNDAALEVQGLEAKVTGLQADIVELEEEKADVREELERSRRLYKQEQAVTEQKRKEAVEQGYLEGYQAGEKAGAVSSMGQLNAMMNKRKREQEEKEAQEQWQKED